VATPLTVVGSPLSPYVRKVLVVLHEKGVAYEIDPIVPFYGDDRFTRLSPLRRIPVLIDDRVTLADSSVICQYLEDRHPAPALYPLDIVDRARARWLEEFADSRMGDVFIWRLFDQLAIRPAVWGRPGDDAIVKRALEEEIPEILDYLETQLPAHGFLFDAFSIADISIAAFFRNAAFVRYRPDPTRWPTTSAYVARVLSRESFGLLAPIEDRLRRTAPAAHRATLAEMGVALTRETFGTETPRAGPMTARSD
jgi:glutathione S-transferase